MNEQLAELRLRLGEVSDLRSALRCSTGTRW